MTESYLKNNKTKEIKTCFSKFAKSYNSLFNMKNKEKNQEVEESGSGSKRKYLV